MMTVKRVFRHLLLPQWSIRRAFPGRVLQAIEAAIGESEKRHDAELRFAVEAGLPLADLLRGVSARARAIDVFAQLRVWDTEHNSGVLVYVSFADHAVEIVADRGISAKVAEEEWQHVCQTMLADFQREAFVSGLVAGLQEVTHILSTHFPRAQAADFDELPNEVVLR